MYERNDASYNEAKLEASFVLAFEIKPFSSFSRSGFKFALNLSVEEVDF